MVVKPSPPPTYRKTKLEALEFATLRTLQSLDSRLGLQNKKILLACSGGLDSICLMHVMCALKNRLGFELQAVYVHHGTNPGKTHSRQNSYRAKAEAFVKAEAEKRGISCLIIRPNQSQLQNLTRSSSEESLRNYRYQALRGHLDENVILVTGHHQDDLLESRLIRLTRGTGQTGLRSMLLYNPRLRILRPFLNCAKSELQAYAHKQQFRWFEDPSNLDLGPLRNWLRLRWLPELEVKRRGAKKNLALSLARITEALAPKAGASRISSEKIVMQHLEFHLAAWRKCTESTQLEFLANVLRQMDVEKFTSRQLLEIRKRLKPDWCKQQQSSGAQSNRQRLTVKAFVLFGVKWRVSRDVAIVEKQAESN